VRRDALGRGPEVGDVDQVPHDVDASPGGTAHPTGSCPSWGCAVGRQRSGTTSGAPMRAESAVSSSGMVWLSRSASTRLR
jgi:hypothetical protein